MTQSGTGSASSSSKSKKKSSSSSSSTPQLQQQLPPQVAISALQKAVAEGHVVISSSHQPPTGAVVGVGGVQVIGRGGGTHSGSSSTSGHRQVGQHVGAVSMIGGEIQSGMLQQQQQQQQHFLGGTYAAGGKMTREASYTTARGETIISERIIEHEVKVPKRVIREDVIEKVIVVPEKIVREDIVEDTVNVREKIIEVAKPVIQERIVEVPEIEYVERIVEVPEKIVQEKVREVPKIEYQERIVEIPKIVMQEKIVEVPDIEYREVPVEKIVEVPEIREQVVVKEVPMPQYIEKPIPEYVTVEVPQEVEHNVPVPIEAITSFAYKLPKLQPKYNPVELTLYVPRFVEVPVPAEFMEESHRIQAEQFASQVNILAQQKAASLCEVENLAGAIKGADFGNVFAGAKQADVIAAAWGAGRMEIRSGGQPAPVTSATATARRHHHKASKTAK